jgi:transcriptional regulator
MARKFQELRDRMTPAARARVEARVSVTVQEMRLEQLRRAREHTQATLAVAMETTQGEVSKLEKRTDCYVSTLRSYIEALGGELEIVARFEGQVVKINQFGELAQV